MQKPVVNVMVKAARAAGNVLLRHMNKLDAINVSRRTAWTTPAKSTSMAEKAIVKELRRAFPDYAASSARKAARQGRKGGALHLGDRPAGRHQQLPARLPALVRVDRAGRKRRAACTA